MISDMILGSSPVYAVTGDPVAHSFSPVIHNTLAGMLGDPNVYIPLHVKPENLGEAIRGAHALGIRGINVTIPHKKDVIPFLSALDDEAAEVGAVNTLKWTERGYTGYNTDCYGLEKTFSKHGIPLRKQNIVILGAGGSAYAAAVMAARQNAGKIFILNRTAANALALVKNIKKYYNIAVEAFSYEQLSLIDRPSILIQTTSLGFGTQKEASPVVHESFFDKAEVALDIIYTPWETRFLQTARKHGLTCINGFAMLIYQAMASYEIWNSRTIPDPLKDKLAEELREYYTRHLTQPPNP